MRITYFLIGAGVALGCFWAPSSVAGSASPFSEHMLRHTALLLVAGPLMAAGLGPTSVGSGLGRFSTLVAKYPFAPWLTGIALMWLWHLPALYNAMPMATMGSASKATPDGMALLHGVSMLAGGAVFCWPVIMPYPPLRLMPLKAVLYLSSACVFCSLLGLLITFAPVGTFTGVTAADQQIGGLIMWVPCCFIYLSASMYILIKWLSQGEERRLVHSLNNPS